MVLEGTWGRRYHAASRSPSPGVHTRNAALLQEVSATHREALMIVNGFHGLAHSMIRRCGSLIASRSLSLIEYTMAISRVEGAGHKEPRSQI